MASKKQPFDEFEIRELSPDVNHWRNCFDSRFLRVFALNGQPRVCTITDVKELLSKGKDESKLQLLVFLEEFDKPWAINITNSESIALLHGDKPSAWVGKRVELYPTKTRFGREVVDCIRVRDKVPDAPFRQDRVEAMQAQKTQASAQPPKRELSARVKELMAKMAEAKDAPALQAINDELVDDNSLSESETALLVRALTRRQEQLEQVPA